MTVSSPAYGYTFAIVWKSKLLFSLCYYFTCITEISLATSSHSNEQVKNAIMMILYCNMQQKGEELLIIITSKTKHDTYTTIKLYKSYVDVM